MDFLNYGLVVTQWAYHGDQKLVPDAAPVKETATTDSHHHIRLLLHVGDVISRPDSFLAYYADSSLHLLGRDKGRSGHLGCAHYLLKAALPMELVVDRELELVHQTSQCFLSFRPVIVVSVEEIMLWILQNILWRWWCRISGI